MESMSARATVLTWTPEDGKRSQAWLKQEPIFVIGDWLIAIGGFIGTSPASSSAEIFMEEKGWRIEPRFNMSAPRDLHCTVVLGSWLFTVGGLVGEASFDNASNMVEAIDTTVDSSTWITKASMLKEDWAMPALWRPGLGAFGLSWTTTTLRYGDTRTQQSASKLGYSHVNKTTMSS